MREATFAYILAKATSELVPQRRRDRVSGMGREHAGKPGDVGATEARMTDLEVRYSYLERTVAELDQVVIQLRAELDKLRRELGIVQNELKESPAEDPPNEKPPHY